MYFAHRSSHKVYTMSHFRYENLRVCKKKESSENAMPKIIMMMVFFFFFGKTKASLAVDRYQFVVQLCSLYAIFMLIYSHRIDFISPLRFPFFSHSVSRVATAADTTIASVFVAVDVESHISFCNN